MMNDRFLFPPVELPNSSEKVALVPLYLPSPTPSENDPDFDVCAQWNAVNLIRVHVKGGKILGFYSSFFDAALDSQEEWGNLFQLTGNQLTCRNPFLLETLVKRANAAKEAHEKSSSESETPIFDSRSSGADMVALMKMFRTEAVDVDTPSDTSETGALPPNQETASPRKNIFENQNPSEFIH
jgi:hypothetical protein